MWSHNLLLGSAAAELIAWLRIDLLADCFCFAISIDSDWFWSIVSESLVHWITVPLTCSLIDSSLQLHQLATHWPIRPLMRSFDEVICAIAPLTHWFHWLMDLVECFCCASSRLHEALIHRTTDSIHFWSNAPLIQTELCFTDPESTFHWLLRILDS